MSKKEEQAYAKRIIDDYVSSIDWRTKENSNVGYSIGGLILHNSSALIANYWLNEVYTPEIAEAHQKASFHIHDLGFLGGYCAGWSLRQLVEEGLGGVEGKISSKPASHLVTLCNQMVNFLGVMQNEWAGAQAFSSFDTYLAPFIKKENLSDKKIKQALQSFIFGVNTPSRWGTQAPFSNITLDWVCPEDMKEKKAIVGGKEQDFTYGDCQSEMDRLNSIYIDLILEGDANGRGFQYPIPTYNLTKEFNWDGPNCQKLFEMTGKYGTPYFQNFINSDLNPSDVRSMCVTGDTLVRAEFDGKKSEIDIKTLLEKPKDSFRILTSQGYRNISTKFILPYSGKIYSITTSSGKNIKTTADHPHLIYDNRGKLEVIRAEDLKVGMVFSCKKKSSFVEYNVNRKGKTFEQLYGKEKADRLKKEKSKLMKTFVGEKNPMFGKHHTEEAKSQISQKLKGHNVTENCRIKSSERWLGFNNPVAKDSYWKNNMRTKKNFSKYEFSFAEELEALGIDFEHQKIFYSDSRTFVADFFIEDKNLIIELETKQKKSCFNEESTLSKEKFDFYRNNNFDVLVINPKEKDYRQYINSSEEIASIEVSDFDGLVYDVEIENTDGKYQVHDFYANDILTHNCCRLQLSLTELRKRGGGLFGADEFTGSMGVVTINLPQIAFLAIDEQDFYERLEKLMVLAKDSLILKRKKVTELNNMGMFPFTKRYLSSFRNHFNTIGVCGMNEACINFFDKDIASEEGKAFAERVLNFMRDKMVHFQEETGELFNLEATPAESTSYRLAKHDKKNFPGIHASGNGEPYYTNSSQLPVNYTADIFEALDHQESLQCAYTGGTVVHTNLGQRVEDWKTTRELVKTIASNYKIPYFTISPIYSICPVHGYLDGEHEFCPKCKEEKIRRIDAQIESLRQSEENVTI